MNFTASNHFEDNRLNALSDRLLFFVKENVSVSSTEEKLILTGKVAAIMQNELSGTATNLIFITAETEIFEYLNMNIQFIFPKVKTIFFKERLLLDFGFVKVEIWFSQTPITALFNPSKIYYQLYSEIPPITLS